MKKFLMCLFTLLFVVSASVCGGFLLSGCDYSESAKDGIEANLTPSSDEYWTDSGNYDTTWSGGGTSSSPYLISTPQELAGLAYRVNNGTSYSGVYFEQTVDLDISAYWWIPMETFAGHYDGGDFTISGVYTDVGTNAARYGLFGYVAGSSSSNLAYIENVHVVNSYIQSSNNNTAGIAGIAYNAYIYNCSFSGSVSSDHGCLYIGGIVGYAESSTISNSYNYGNISGFQSVGGIVGHSLSSNINQCMNEGDVNSSESAAGGIVGAIYGETRLNNSYNAGEISSASYYAGGLVGYIRNTGSYICTSYNRGSISGYGNIGGGIGFIASSNNANYIYNIFSVGSVTATSTSYVGGLVGRNTSDNGARFYRCYSGGACSLGALGTSSSSINRTDSSYYATYTSSLSSASSTATFVQNSSNWSSSYTWSTSVWNIDTGANEGYPYLITISYYAPSIPDYYWTSSGNYDTSWSGGGTESNPYLITSEKELAGLAYMVDAGTTYSNTYFRLTVNLDLSDYWWDPIGDYSAHRFAGHFDGRGHTISGLFTKQGTSADYSYQGLFGYVLGTSSNYATIENVYIINSNVQGYSSVGAIAGYAHYANITGCGNRSDVTGQANVIGGIVGRLGYGTISQSYNLGTIKGAQNIGGIAGDINGIIENCYNIGNVESSATWVGGITGVIFERSGNYVANCYNLGTVSGTHNIGGVVGDSRGLVTNCYNLGEVIGDYTVGGVVSYNYPDLGSTSNCYYGGDCSNIGGINGSNVSDQAEYLSTLATRARTQSWYTSSSNWNSSYSWNFSSVWKIDSESNFGYPIFKYQDIITITLDRQSGSGGALAIYLRYGIAWFSDSAATNEITSVRTPTRSGYTFQGFYTIRNGAGNPIINSSRQIVGSTTYTSSNLTIYAYWAPIYTISLNTQSGTGGPSAIYLNYRIGWFSNSSATSQITSITTPTRTNYIFQGYYQYANGSGTQIINSSGQIIASNTFFTSNTTIWAYWTAIYTITLDKQGGSGGTNNIYIANGRFTSDSAGQTQITSIDDIPTLAGYSFEGYFTESGGGGSQIVNRSGAIVGSASYTSANDTLYAYWTPNTYILTVNANSGTIRHNVITPSTILNDSTVTGNNSRVTYDASSGEYTFTIITNSDPFATINAKATLSAGTYYMHVRLENTSGALVTQTNALQVFYAISQGYNEPMSLRFSGDQTLSFTVSTAGTYDFRFDNDTGSTLIIKDFWIGSSTTYTSDTYEIVTGNNFQIPTPTRSGYEFDGWDISGAGTTMDGNVVTMGTANATITARWTTARYTITWNGNVTDGGLIASSLWNFAGSTGYTSSNTGNNSSYTTSATGFTATSQVSYNNTLAYYTPIPIRSGYTFAGWYSSNGTQVADANGNLVANASGYTDSSRRWIRASDTTLYAHWTIKTYSISYNYGGGSASGNQNSYSVTTNRTINTPTRAGYTFAGWTVTMTLNRLYSGHISQDTGVQSYSSTYPNAVYYEMFYIDSDIRYTGALSGGQIRYRMYNTDGSYDQSSGSTSITGFERYCILWYHLGNNNETTTVTFDLDATSFTTSEFHLVGDLSITAKWTPNSYVVTLDAQNNTGEGDGTEVLYLLYGTGWYTNEAHTEAISIIEVPKNDGFSFQGYFTNTNGTGVQIIDNDGYILNRTESLATSDTTLYAYWTPLNSAYYDEEEGYWYVEMGEYPQSSIIENDLSNWTGNHNYSAYTFTYNKTTNMTDIELATAGGWEVVSFAFPAITGATSYTLTFDYKVYTESYTGRASSSISDLSQVMGYDGLAIQVLSQTPNSNDNTTIDYLTYRIPAEASSGTAVANFTVSSSVTTLYIAINGGYAGDGENILFSLGNFYLATSGTGSLQANEGDGSYYTLPVLQEDGSWDMERFSSYTLSDGEEYIRYVDGNWFKVEPVKYILADDQNDIAVLKEEREFTGSTGSNYINLGRNYMYTDAITVSLWGYMDDWSQYGSSSGSGNMRLISCTEAGGWNIESSSGRINFAMYDSGVGYKSVTLDTTWASLESGWHMFTVTFDGEYARAYIDGVLQGTSTRYTSGRIGYNSGNAIFIGAEAGNNSSTPNGQYFIGKIKEVYILDRALSQTEITALMGGYVVGYGTTEGNITAVSEKVIFASVWNEGNMQTGTGFSDAVISSNFTNYFYNESNLDLLYERELLAQTDDKFYSEIYNSHQTVGTTIDYLENTSATVASTREIDEVFGDGTEGSADYQAEFTDFVKNLLGRNLMYWTRDVGTNLDNAECISRLGRPIQSEVSSLLGARVTLNVKTISCVQ